MGAAAAGLAVLRAQSSHLSTAPLNPAPPESSVKPTGNLCFYSRGGERLARGAGPAKATAGETQHALNLEQADR